MDYTTVPIRVLSSPTDWPTVYSAFAAAFLCAITAFTFTIFLDRVRERERRLASVNSAMYGLLMSMSTLVNLKEQHLTKFQQEFDELQELIAATDLFASEEETAIAARIVGTQINEIGEQDSNLNGLLIPTQEVSFPMTPDPGSLLFTAPASPDIVRLVHVAKTEMDGITGAIRERNMYWRDNANSTFADDKERRHVKKFTFVFQMLAFRKMMREHTDTALVVAQEALDQIESYRKRRLKKRAWFSRWLFLLFTEKEAWVTYAESPRIKKNMPDKANYKSILNLAE